LGVETTVEGGIGRNIFLRGGYTYLDAVVQRSFANDDVALLGPVPTYGGIPNGIPIGEDSPLQVHGHFAVRRIRAFLPRLIQPGS